MAPSTHPQRIPCLKTLRWDSQALCERVRDESCFLTCGERRCWNLSSQLLLYCDILHSNFPYFTESDASLISTELRSQFRHLLPQYVVEICTLCCVILFTVSDCIGNGITCGSRVLDALLWGDLLSKLVQTLNKESTHWNCSVYVCVWMNMRNYSVLLCHKMEKVRKESFWSGRRPENNVLK